MYPLPIDFASGFLRARYDSEVRQRGTTARYDRWGDPSGVPKAVQLASEGSPKRWGDPGGVPKAVQLASEGEPKRGWVANPRASDGQRYRKHNFLK
jgi:hypothetical protein